MEKENRKSNLVFFIITGVIIIGFLVYYGVMLSLSPEKWLNEVKNEKSAKADEITEKIGSDSAYLGRLREKSFLQSRTTLAQQDSIYLVIDLSEGISRLEISGVTIYKTKIHDYQISSVLREGDKNLLYTLFSSPLTIQNANSTIRKEPLMIKTAPKDTSEYEPDIIPDTSLTEPVNYILEMNNKIRIYVMQEENQSKSDKRSNIEFDLRDRLKFSMNNVKDALKFKVPEYYPYIKIRIPKADARIIYRAIPRNGQVAIRT
jgi:hypothetical protein